MLLQLPAFDPLKINTNGISSLLFDIKCNFSSLISNTPFGYNITSKIDFHFENLYEKVIIEKLVRVV